MSIDTEDNGVEADADKVEILQVSLCRKEEKIQLQTNGGEVITYTLREMTGSEMAKWRNSLASKMKIGSNGMPVGVKSFDGLESSLIAKCLVDPEGKLVKQEIIDDWPASTLKALFVKCQKLNGMEEESREAAKKD